MRWVIPFVSFCAGSSFGILTMCCVIANRWNEKEKEVMADAGGSGKQDSESGDLDHEADGPDADGSSAQISQAQGKSEGSESS